ncbi:major facilitator superfamily domain-containing protein [Mycena galopus ATCC 62051]|nr:major facilitator superfamily domain-containing protein [Mycena galopus ATCC 62051]
MTGGGFLPSLGRTSSADGSRWTGSAGVVGPSWAHLPTLTIGLLGVQIFWSVEMSYASPYLLSLGLTTSHVALVFLAGPLAGLVVQPLVGAYADTNTSRWGRRRPYVLGGCLISVAGMLLLGYTRAIAGLFLARGGHAHGVLTIILAILAIFVIDFSINAVQAVDRALLVDTLPPAQQPAGNACAALMLGFGSVVGFFIGNLPLRTMLPFLQAESELQALSVLVSVLLLVCHGLTAALVSERVLLKSAGARTPSLRHELREIYTHARVLPSVIRQICFIQFFAWLGWFPVAFYTTMYITDVYLQDTALSASSSANSSLASSVLSTTPTNGTTSYPPPSDSSPPSPPVPPPYAHSRLPRICTPDSPPTQTQTPPPASVRAPSSSAPSSPSPPTPSCPSSSPIRTRARTAETLARLRTDARAELPVRYF